MSDEMRAPVQPSKKFGKGHGTVEWPEHVEAWLEYHKHYSQSAERVAERGGFGYSELVQFLGHEPTTWKARI